MLNSWWNAQSAGEQIAYGFIAFFILGLIAAQFTLKTYRKGFEEGWAKGYVRGKTVASERPFD
jgi:hypothetical protein